MKASKGGYVLLTLSTVAASLFAARTPVLRGWFAFSLVVMALSIWLLRRGAKADSGPQSLSGSAGAFDFEGCLRTVTGMLDDLASGGEGLSVGVIHRELDRLVEGPLFEFAEARRELLSAYGFAAYARVVSEFTRGERAVNRAWSAAVDGYREEAGDSVKYALEVFGELRRSLASLSSKQAG